MNSATESKFTLTLAPWTHPATGEVRTYINNLSIGSRCKVWLSDVEAGSYCDVGGKQLHVKWNSPVDKAGWSQVLDMLIDEEIAPMVEVAP